MRFRPGNVHSADDWRSVLEPVVTRYRGKVKRRYFRGDAAFASADLYEFLEAEGFTYAIRLKANAVLRRQIAHLLKRPVGRPPNHVRRILASYRRPQTKAGRSMLTVAMTVFRLSSDGRGASGALRNRQRACPWSVSRPEAAVFARTAMHHGFTTASPNRVYVRAFVSGGRLCRPSGKCRIKSVLRCAAACGHGCPSTRPAGGERN